MVLRVLKHCGGVGQRTAMETELISEAFLDRRSSKRDPRAVGRNFELPSLGLLRFSTIGVALFDGNLHCRAFNGALAPNDWRVSKKAYRQTVASGISRVSAPKLEIAFRRVWATGNSVSDLELTARVARRNGTLAAG